jgi:hypothetical protein
LARRNWPEAFEIVVWANIAQAALDAHAHPRQENVNAGD